MLPILESGEETLVGGQAVMEGVMMRAPHSYCVAVRRANGEMVTEEMPLARISETYKIFKYPVFRGVGTLYQAMKLGIKALQFSTNAAMQDLPPEQRKDGSVKEPPKEMPKWVMALNLVMMVGSFLFLYKWLPLYLAGKLGQVYPVFSGRVAANLADGVIRIIIFLFFMGLISRMKDIRRVFEYHGAEHKVVFNFESGQPVSIENAQRFTTFHPRCGTSFLMLLMIVSLVIYPFMPFDGFLAKFLIRLALLPVVVGVCYELIRFASRKPGFFMSILTAPGLWLQRITTKPPADDQAAVAIHALEGAMALEKQQGGELVIA
ncbi:MAG TPA: DUF1385 domain-containing protein [Candidatus Sulfopaludibacter sp.]|jgi:uncharacterized protein YqhQ|nr:DUF1385 domain-containing protein [Candidatus Sulfopaludibacter sp.]